VFLVSTHQQVKSSSTVKKMLDNAKKKDLTLAQFIDRKNPLVARYDATTNF